MARLWQSNFFLVYLFLYTQRLSNSVTELPSLILHNLFWGNWFDFLLISLNIHVTWCISFPMEQNKPIYTYCSGIIIITELPHLIYLEVPQLSLVTANFKWSRLLLAKIEHPLTEAPLSPSYKHACSVETVWIQQMILHAAQKYTWGEQLLFPETATKITSYTVLFFFLIYFFIYLLIFFNLLFLLRTKSETAEYNCHKKVAENLLEGSKHPKTCIRASDNFAKASCCAFYIAQLYPMDPASLYAGKCLIPQYLHTPLLMQIPVVTPVLGWVRLPPIHHIEELWECFIC